MSASSLSEVVLRASVREFGAYRSLVEVAEAANRMRDELVCSEQLTRSSGESAPVQRQRVVGTTEVLDRIPRGDGKQCEEVILTELARGEQGKIQPIAGCKLAHRVTRMHVCAAKRVFASDITVVLGEKANGPKKTPKTRMTEPSCAALCVELTRRPAPVPPSAGHGEPIGTEQTSARRAAKTPPSQVFQPSSDHHCVGIEAQKEVELSMVKGVAVTDGDLHPQSAVAARRLLRRLNHVHVGRHLGERAETFAMPVPVVDDHDGSWRLGIVQHARHGVFDVIDWPRGDDDCETGRAAHAVCITESQA